MTRTWTTRVFYAEAIDPAHFEPIPGCGQWGERLPDGSVEWRENADCGWKVLSRDEAEDQQRREDELAATYRTAR
jgi:hypothetical protein